MTNPLTKEFNYYLANQDEMVQKYDGKVVVTKGLSVIGVYPTKLDAVVETQKTHEIGTFLIQKVSEGSEAYTHTFIQGWCSHSYTIRLAGQFHNRWQSFARCFEN